MTEKNKVLADVTKTLEARNTRVDILTRRLERIQKILDQIKAQPTISKKQLRGTFMAWAVASERYRLLTMPIPKFPPGSPGHLATVGEGGPETIQLVGNKWVQPPKSSARFYVYAALDQWMAWTYTTFDKATALSALNKASDELKEAKHEIIRESPGAPGSSLVLEELADVILCVFSSAAKLGFSVEQVFLAIKEKAKINYEREWIYDPQTQTYSHKKPSKQ